MKTSAKKVQQCVCGRFVRTRKSSFTRLDLKFGAALVTIAVVALLIRAPVAFAIIVFPLLAFPWLVIFVIALAKGHSSKCAARWAAVMVVGSLGGNWF